MHIRVHQGPESYATYQTDPYPEELYLRLRQVVAEMSDLRVDPVSPEISRGSLRLVFSLMRLAIGELARDAERNPQHVHHTVTT